MDFGGAIIAFDRVVVIGLGLIGGSIARALVPLVEVVGVDPDPATIRAAKLDGIESYATLDAACALVTYRSLIVVATPVDHIASTLEVLANLATRPLITDVCSVKVLVEQVARGRDLRFIGGHPMAGSEQHGYRAASDSLFSGTRWALMVDGQTDLGDWFAIVDLVVAMGATAMPSTPDAHDQAVAAVSHLPHVLAAALAGATDNDHSEVMLGLAAGSFRDGTRVARSDPAFWASVVRENASNMIPLLHTMRDELDALAVELERGSSRDVLAYFARGERARRRYEDRTARTQTLLCENDASARATLADLGERGGSVTGQTIIGSARHIHARVPDRAQLNAAQAPGLTNTAVDADDGAESGQARQSGEFGR